MILYLNEDIQFNVLVQNTLGLGRSKVKTPFDKGMD